ncbi:hypothetical protein N665_0066s0082 [Sinapis alba]|nr:hypothetical protein N665_0066s0082 [Sinapis alba]
MDSSDARLDTIEAQRSMDGFDGQQKQRYSPMSLITNCLRILPPRCFLQARGEDTMGETESVPEYLTNLKLADLFNPPGESVAMNPEIFSAVSAGSKECLEKIRSYGEQMACLKSHRGDSILHLAAAWGHLEVVQTIVSECPCLLLEPNLKNQLPLHVAALDGRLAVVEALVSTVTFVSEKLSEEDRVKLNVYVVKDIDGDTPLNLALKGFQMDTALHLVKAHRLASFLANNDGISPLYLAAKEGNVSLVNAMLKTTESDSTEGKKSSLDLELEGRKFLVHAALEARNIDIVDVLLKEYPTLGDERDEEGRTCLSLAASNGFYEGVCNLLDRSTKSVYECDDDGSFPIHMAAKIGHVKIVKELLTRCSDSKHLVNKQGQNILHVAANGGKFLLVNHLTRRDTTKDMGVEQDVDGNTPLHLATLKWRHRIIFLLSRVSTKKCMYTRNNSGLTALDIAESLVQPNYIFRERMTLLVIVFLYGMKDTTLMWTKKLTRPSYPLNRDNNREYINALLLVGTLIATVTFAAGFTIPGGFNSSAPHLGRAILVNDLKLIYFLACDTLAMQSSVIAIATLIWAQLGDPALVHRSLNVALPLLFFALLCMPAAFSFAMSIIAGSKGLMKFLNFTFTMFLYGMIFILGPHVILQIPGIPAYFGLYFVQFMLLYGDGDATDQTSLHISSKDQDGKTKNT